MKNRFFILFFFSILIISCTQQQERKNPMKGVWKMVGAIKYENNKPVDTLTWDSFGFSEGFQEGPELPNGSASSPESKIAPQKI